MKRIRSLTAIIISCAMILTFMSSCSSKQTEANNEVALNNKEFLDSLSDEMCSEIANTLDSGVYRVDSVEAVYISKEYIEELDYNSQSNVFFGYTLEELDEMFEGEKYVFSLGEDGNTVVKEFEDQTSSISKSIKNIATGTGAVLICVAVTIIAIKTGPAVARAFLKISPKLMDVAKTDISKDVLMNGLSVIGAGIVEGLQTKDFGKALDAMKDEALEEFAIEAVAGLVQKDKIQQ